MSNLLSSQQTPLPLGYSASKSNIFLTPETVGANSVGEPDSDVEKETMSGHPQKNGRTENELGCILKELDLGLCRRMQRYARDTDEARELMRRVHQKSIN